jgi:4-hydroxybenzoate polyprenyltransferase
MPVTTLKKGLKMSSNQVIAVDLDGTLTLTDTLHESIILLIRNKPLYLFIIPFWLTKGIAFLKLKVAQNIELDVKNLPYNVPLIDWLKKEKDNGKKIVLCTAANEHIAQAVSKHLQLFDDIISSDANTNLIGINKRKALQDRFGDKGYDYAGNSISDMEVWSSSSKAIVVNASSAVQTKATKITTVSRTFPSESIGFSDWIKALRVYQWSKNLLLFIPLLASHQLGNFQSLPALAIAFISFSLCASSVYIINDLLDLESDRKHPRKKNRPFSAAKLSIVMGIAIAPFLIIASFILGFMINEDFFIVLILYFILTSTYSLFLKRIVLVDCLTLAILYTVRIIAGAAVISVSLSFWLLAFSVFIFLSLAFVKRYTELMVQVKAGNNYTHGRGYEVSDSVLIQILGVSAGYLSVLVMALYMQSEDIMNLYVQPTAIWFAIPLLLFWISWVWLKATRGLMHDDPIVFAIKDKASIFVAVLTALVFLYAAKGLGV